MKHLAHRTAVITGAASGIGLGLARACAAAGMNVALMDIRPGLLQQACAKLEDQGAAVFGVTADVSDPASVQAAADAVQKRFGKVHLLANNAGVAVHGKPIAEVPLADWSWALGVNVMGVVHGVRAFLPLLKAHGEGGHILNTASIAGFQVRPGWNGGPYSATKYAVVALSESLRNELDGTGIDVTVLCPGAVRTSLADSQGARPERFGDASRDPVPPFLDELLASGADPDEIAQIALRAVRENHFFVFTNPAQRVWVEERHGQLMEAFDRA